MAFNIETFKSEGLRLGGARPSLFEVQIPDWPGALPGAPSQLRFLAKATSLPPSIISEIEVPYFGRRIKIVGDRAYPNWTMTVMNEEDFYVRQSLMAWHTQMNTEQRNTMAGDVNTNISSYKRNIYVFQYSKAGGIDAGTNPEPIFSCTIVGAFPVNISQIGLDWEAVNQVEQFDVEFAYDYWVPRVISESVSDSGTTLEEIVGR